MKDILLFLMRRCKWHITITISCLVMIVLTIHTISGFMSLEYILATLTGYIFFVAALWNVRLLFAPSMDENSNAAVVFSRWGVILVSLSMLSYLLLETLFMDLKVLL